LGRAFHGLDKSSWIRVAGQERCGAGANGNGENCLVTDVTR
jgi:hypothetical protein